MSNDWNQGKVSISNNFIQDNFKDNARKLRIMQEAINHFKVNGPSPDNGFFFKTPLFIEQLYKEECTRAEKSELFDLLKVPLKQINANLDKWKSDAQAQYEARRTEEDPPAYTQVGRRVPLFSSIHDIPNDRDASRFLMLCRLVSPPWKMFHLFPCYFS